MAASKKTFAPSALYHRLLHDIAEIQQDPYPNAHLHVDEQDFREACLILSTEAYGPLHHFIEFGNNYPLYAPSISIQSEIVHSNIYGNYICAGVLNTEEGWTPAYTLKGVLIQLLSFFTSDSLVQDHGKGVVNLRKIRIAQKAGDDWRYGKNWKAQEYFCEICGNGPNWAPTTITKSSNTGVTTPPATISKMLALTDEVVLLMLEEMATKDVLALADAVPLVKHTIHSYDFIRTRELQCLFFFEEVVHGC